MKSSGTNPHWQIFLVGVAISTVWIFNVRAAVADPWQGAIYALGAGLGTYLAMKVRIRKG